MIPDFETFDRLSFDYDDGDSVIKFLVTGRESEQLQIYFMDTVKFNEHWPFLSVIGVEIADVVRGRLIYDQDLVADDGSPGVYRYRFMKQIESFSFTERVHTLLAANMPLLDDNLAMWIKNRKLREFQDDLPLYRSSRIDIVFDDDVYGETDFLALNQAAGYGLLRELDADERPHPRDVVIYQALPNELPRVAGIISTVPQTPLSHVNLRAAQDGVPNAFIADALENDDISDLIGSHVYYQVTDTGYTIRAATQAEVEAHFASSRPARTQTPQSDLTVTAITPLSDIDFDDWDAFGVKAANVAVLGTLEFPEGTVPDGFAIPFYFYDEFMKHNDLDDDIEEMLADSDFQTDYDTMASELKKLRKKIKKAEVPEWIETALTTMHGNYPDGQSLRYRSSTNNEDLPNFNGAGLYDSKTQHPEETEEDGISKSLKQVYASLWNFRAFLERDFHRIDHLSTYMGALVHPNYSDDRVNGVAVSADPVTGTWSSYYVNAQVGEDLVTNPEVNSAPEELLLNPRGGYTVLALSNQAPRGDLLMTDDQMAQLRRRLVTIHDRFKELYGVRSGEPFAMEIEFKVTSDNVLAIKQARPWVFPPLTGRFDLDTAAHGGSPFTVRIRFSAPTTIIRSNLRDRAVSVTGGRVTGARRTTYSPISEWWEIDVTPDSLGDVTIAVAHNRPCNNVAAICTSDGKRLSNHLERTIKGYLNNPATGLPTISGTAQVGETLTADTSGIVDEDGLENVSYSYQWLRNDGTTDSGIQDAVNSTYTLVSDDSGRTIKVRVTFTDDAGNEESLTSDATTVVAAATSPTNPATGAPTISGTAQVGETLTADTSGIVDGDGLENVSYSYQWLRSDGTTDSDIQDATGSTYALVSGDSGKAIKVRVTFTDDAGNEEALTSDATAVVAAATRPNNLATGAPTISGAAQVGEALTADTSGIDDDDGLDNPTFSYQWIRNDGTTDSDIQDATASTYTLTVDDSGKTIRVRVSFTDDLGYGEILTSAATAEVTAGSNSTATGLPTITGTLEVLQTLRAQTSGIGDDDGLDNVSFEYQWVALDGGLEYDIQGATGPTYTLRSAELGKTIKVRVSFDDDLGYKEILTSAATAEVTAGSNQTATGLPTITGTTEVLQALTAHTSSIEDEDGLDHVSFEYQWVAVDGGVETDIPGATTAIYNLVAAYRNNTIKVRVSFDDDRGYRETLTSAATEEVSPAPNTPATGSPTIRGSWAVLQVLTASTAGIADENGVESGSFTYQWLAVDGGVDTEIEGATNPAYRLSSAEQGKAIKVRVGFIDNGGNEETLTSAATATVRADRVGRRSCPAGAGLPSPTDVAVTSVPIVVESTTDDYFVLYSSQTVDGTRLEYPVLVKRGEDGTTTLEENVEALPAERYRVEKYLITHPADVDGDCVDDITELDDPAGKNPVNPAHLDPADGVVIIPDEDTFDDFSYSNILNVDDYRRRGEVKFIKFTILGIDTGRPVVYFIDKSIGWHNWFVRDLSIDLRDGSDLAGQLIRYDNVFAPDGSLGLYVFELDDFPGFAENHYVYGLLAASIRPIADNLIYSPQSTSHYLNSGEQAKYEASRMDVMLEEDIFPDGDFTPLNLGEGYGFLRVMSLDEQPNPRDIVIYESLPNDLPPVSGIITAVRQTPLSHVNLRAMQNGVPNAFVRNALDHDDIDELIDSHVYYQVTGDGYTIRAATPAEVEAHYASSRPASAQTPERDLSVTTITPLSQVAFDVWDAFGVKAANVAVLGTLEFPEGTVPDGFTIPFYFYDEFMKHNELYDDIEEMLADEDFQTDYDTMASELKKLRKKIKKADTPDWIETALTAMHATYPEGQSLRYRSSTNNEDLPGFNGAGLYDSKTQHPEDTEEDGISKSLKQVYASMWNFRAVVEREFHRIDHAASAMGVLVHPNYSDERVNGVAVSVDPTYATEGAYYVNSQVGEDLVTNPEANSVPEELLLRSNGTHTIIERSNQATDDQLLMTSEQMTQLRRHLTAIHDKFEELYGIEDGEQFAMEIEFKITSDNVLAIKQARPWNFGPVASRLNSLATGLPTISGTPQVGETLTAETSGIADDDGLENVSYSYLWIRNDGTTDSGIQGATGSTYTLTSDDEGKTIKVRVFFTDDASNAETLTSDATAVVAAADTLVGFTLVDTSDQSEMATLTDGAAITLVDPAGGSYGIRVEVATDTEVGSVRLELSGEKSVSRTENTQPYSLYGDDGTNLNGESLPAGSYTFSATAYSEDNLGGDELQALETAFSVAATNNPATGAPTISGTAQAGETLTADTSGIDDGDGLSNATFAYQWIRDDGTTDSDIQDATNLTYTLVSDDSGKAIKVRVSFTDDAGNAETLTSQATATVATQPNNPATGVPTISGTAQVGETLTAETSGIDDGDGLSNPAFSYQWIRNDGTTDSDIQDAAGSTYTLTSDDEGKTIKVRVTFTDDAGNEETLTSQATATVATRPNNPAIGVPTISGTAQVGETLTAETSGIDDDDGLSNPTFSYQWIRNDGTTDSDIQDATGSTYTLTSDDEGKTITVRVTFTDDAGNEETLTSDATAVVAAATRPNNPATGAPTISSAAQVGETLTAETSGIVDGDGLSNPTFSYQWTRNDGSTDSGIQDATGSTYTLTSDDGGKTIKVRVTFTDDAGNEEALTSDATAVVAAATSPNNPATGAPTISGTAQMGETLTAETSGIDDDDGLSNPAFSYQWTRNDGSTDSGIQDATGSTYTLTSDDEGKTIKVRVTFTDDAGNEEALTSPPLDPSRPYGLTATASGRTVVLNWKPPAVFPYLYDYQILRHRPELGETEPLVYVDTGTDETTYTDTDVEPGVLYVYRVKAANFFTRLSKASEPTEIRTPSWTPVENSPATGAPTISGAAQVGETLTADMSGIADADGLANATYSYQWLVDDIDITGATGASYTLADSDEGKAMKVRVTFTDDARNEESLTSQATAAVEARANNLATGVPTISGTAQVGETLTADTSGIDDADGLANTAFSFQWTRNDGSADADIQDASGSTYTLTSDDEGKTIRVRVTFTDDAGNAETLTSDATAVVVAVAKPNSPATGQPTISGAAQVGETLTADTSGIADTDGLDNATFSHQWTRNGGSADADIQNATGSTYTLTSDDAGKTIKVRVSFTDDADNAEMLTSDATSTVAAAPIPLTASVHDAPGSHDGENVFTFELRLSREPVSTFSYGTLRDHAFTVTGGEVTKARRLEAPSNVRWEITMTPDGDGNVTVVLTVTQDCADQGAICTRDGRMLSADVTLVVTGPGDEEERNSPATGQPAISGTLQVGETLTASPSGIADADGLDNATFSYQWLADDVDISGAVGDSYTLTDSEEGKAVKVTVSFTDDAGNEESLTSVVTATVAARPLSLDDFDAGEGQTVLASALVQLGNRGRKNNGNQDRAWYASDTSAWHASGKLRDGSLAWNGMTLNRVVYFPETGMFRFNEADDIHIGESFAAGGVNRELTVWIQTETEAVSFLVKDNIRKSGSGYISFETPTGIRPVLGGVSEGDLIIIAVSAPTGS